MSANLLETVQQNLGYPPLQKINPNTQEIPFANGNFNEVRLGQAAIPAVLITLCKYVQTDDGAKSVLLSEPNENWTQKIYNNRNDTMDTITAYIQQYTQEPLEKINAIATEAVKVAREKLGNNATIENVKAYFNDQRNNILLYLPADLHLGVLLDNDALDDRTNKMEGPFSSLMKSIGSAFDTPIDS